MAKRVLYLPLNYGDVVQSGVYDAFRANGCDLKVYDYFYEYETRMKRNVKNLRSDLINAAAQYNPHLVHLQVQHTQLIDGPTIAQIKKVLPNAIIVNWTGDVRNYVPASFADIAKHAHYNLISSVGQLKMFEKELKREVLYWQIGYNPKLYYRPQYNRTNFKNAIAFIGNNNMIEGYPGRSMREQACKMLIKEFGEQFALHGSLWPPELKSRGTMDQKKVSQAYHDSVCSLSISHYNDLSHYFSDRLLMCLASGRPTICYRYPEWQTYFTNNCDLIIVNSIDEIPKKVRMLKADPDMANFIGKSGSDKVLAEHTYKSRIAELLRLIKL